MNILDFEDWLELNCDELYIEYMESGAYYDTDKEVFEQKKYEEYVKRLSKNEVKE